MNTAALLRLAGLGQDMVMPPTQSRAAMREIAIPSYRPQRMRGFGTDGDSVESGDYHIVGTNVILRKGPSSTSENVGTLKNGEGVYAFGDVEMDLEHMVGPGGGAIDNDGTSPGIEYVHIGTQTLGPGWVAINFMTPGEGMAVTPGPAPQPMPAPTPAPTPTPTPTTTKDKMTTVLVGGLIGVAVLGGIVLLVKHSKSPRRLAHA